ncbi:MAG: ABC transporter permease subunit [Clostridia bacterium]|nr:ABC transporter permease subunit [Clostridia bacterium]
MRAIFKREMRSYFTSPIGYVVVIAFWLFVSMLFYMMFSSGAAQIGDIFGSAFSVVLILIPLLTMRSFSEERRQKTDQLYMTAPVRLTAVVLGKFFAALTVFAICLSITVVFMLIFCLYITPDWLVYLGNVVGMLLLGSCFIAVGIFISVLTESQIVSAIGSFSVALVLMLLDYVTSLVGIELLQKAAAWVSFSERYNSFTTGTFDWANVIFFLSLTAVFLFLSVRRLDRRRWA